MTGDYQEKQPSRENQGLICSQEGIKVFDSADQIQKGRSFDRRFETPAGKIIVFFGNEAPLDSKPQQIAYVLDGKSPYRLSTVSDCLKDGLRPVAITLDDAYKYFDTPTCASIWLGGKSAKLVGDSEKRLGDSLGIDFNDRHISSDFYLNPDNPVGKVFVPESFEVLKDLQVSVEAINPGAQPEGGGVS